MSAHAKLSASGATRWMGCPGSVNAEQGLPDTSSPYAEKGTVLHDIAEHMLLTGSDGSEFIGKTHVVFDDKGKPYLEAFIDEEDIENLRIYVDYVRNLGGHMLVEQRVDFSDFVAGGFGTADAVVLVEGVLYVIDLKTGQGNRVEAEENPQLMLYGVGSWAKFDMLMDFHTVKLAIVQPPLDHISEWEISVDDLVNWAENTVRPAAELALTEDAPRVPSADACKWCKAKGRCKEYAKQSLRVVADEFKDVGDFTVQDSDSLTNEDIAAILEKVSLVKGFLDAVTDEATTTIMDGGSIPGFKMVAGRSLRKWKDETQAETALRKKLKVAEAYKKTLITPAQAEKKLGKNHPLLEDLTVKPEGKPTLVPETDKRQALIFNSVEDDFDGFESDAA